MPATLLRLPLPGPALRIRFYWEWRRVRYSIHMKTEMQRSCPGWQSHDQNQVYVSLMSPDDTWLYVLNAGSQIPCKGFTLADDVVDDLFQAISFLPKVQPLPCAPREVQSLCSLVSSVLTDMIRVVSQGLAGAQSYNTTANKTNVEGSWNLWKSLILL